MNDTPLAETFVFMLHSDGTFAWTNTSTTPRGNNASELMGASVWKRCAPADEDRVRDGLVKLMLENKQEFRTTVRDLEGDRLLVCMYRLPVIQPAQHAVVGWCRRLTDEVLTLTEREREILLLVCEEMTSEQIGKCLHIATATVETHRQNIAKKLGTNSVVGQVRAAIRGGLIDA